jgi:beta-glucuronidase
MTSALRLAKGLDPTRLVSIDFAGYPSVRLVQLYRRFDALGMNSYAGWYPGPTGQIHMREVLGQYLNQLHEYYPKQALFVTEFGAEANRPGPAYEKGTFDFQRDFMKFHLGVYGQKRFINGAIAWLLRDFKVRPGWEGGNPYPDPPYNRKGLVNEFGQAKPAYGDVSSMFRGARVPR